MKKYSVSFELHVLEYILIAIVIVYYIGAIVSAPKNGSLDGHVHELSEGWVQEYEDGTSVPVICPDRKLCEEGEICIFVNTLPSLTNSEKLIFYSNVDATVIINNQIRYIYDSSENTFPGEVVKNIVHQVELSSGDSGKEIKIIKGEENRRFSRLSTVVIGDSYGLYMFMFRMYGLSFAVSFTVLFLAVMLTLINVYLNTKLKDSTNMYALIVAIFLVGAWCVSKSMFFQYIFSARYVDGFMSYELAMLLPMPFVMHLNSVQKHRYKTVFSAIEIILFIDFLTLNYLQIFTRYSFLDTKLFLDGIIIVILVLAFCTILKDISDGYSKEYSYIAQGYAGLCIFAFIEVAFSVTGALSSERFNGLFINIGIYFLLIMTLCLLISNLNHVKNEVQNAIRANEQKTGFLARMSHEIRTPINAILGMNEMIYRETTDNTIREYSMDIKGAGGSLLAIVNDILDLSKIEAGKMELVVSNYDLHDMLYDCVNMINVKAEAKSLKLVTDIDEKLPRGLVGDSVRISQCLINLLSNAVKYTESGSVTLRVSGTTENDKARLRFSVEDTGIGIKKEDIPRIYDVFTRVDEEKNHTVEGTGLGINITVNILKLMGSKINIDSTYGLGSKFYFDLEQEIHDMTPIGNIMENDRKEEEIPAITSGFTAESAAILVVDDKQVNRKVVTNLLKITKIKIDEAESGQQCIEMCRLKQYDIILLDHMMPEMDGIETLTRLRDDIMGMNYDTPVIALTANAINGAKEAYLEAGFNAFLPKPIDYEQLEKTVYTYLPNRKINIIEKSDSPVATGGVASCAAGDAAANVAVADNASDEAAIREREISEAINNVQGIDLVIAMKYSPDFESLAEVLTDFYNDIDSELEKINDYFDRLPDEDAYNSYKITVHGIKSAAAMIGAMTLSSAAKRLEMAASDHEIDAINTFTRPFLKELASYKDKLEPVARAFKGDDSEKPMFEDINTVKGQLEVLRSALDDFDFDTADSVVALLSAFKYPESINSLMDELYIAIRNVDDDAGKEIIDKIMEV